MKEDWGSAAPPHNVQGTCRRKRGTCAPRRGGRPVLAGIAERLLEWGSGGRRRGGGPPPLKYPGCPPLGGEGRRKRSERGPPPSRPRPLLGRLVRDSQPASGVKRRRPEAPGARRQGIVVPGTSWSGAFLRLPVLGMKNRESSLPFLGLAVCL